MKPPREFIEEIYGEMNSIAIPSAVNICRHFEDKSPIELLYFAKVMLCFGVRSFNLGNEEEVLKHFRQLIGDKKFSDFAEEIVFPFLDLNSNEGKS